MSAKITLDEKTARELAFTPQNGEEDGWTVVDNRQIDSDRWSSIHSLVITRDGKDFYHTTYSQGLTELQSEMPFQDDGTVNFTPVRLRLEMVGDYVPVWESDPPLSQRLGDAAVLAEMADLLGKAASRMRHLEQVERSEPPKYVYIPEFVDPSDNVWDGRTRYGVHTTLEGALKALAHFGDADDPLMVTQEPRYDNEPADELTWMVHRTSEKPSSDGSLWIFQEKLDYGVES